MAINMKPIVMAGNKDFESIISFHSSQNAAVYYQEYHVPFTAVLMTVSPGNARKSNMTCLIPGTEFFISAESMDGRSSESQHHHNVFEFTYVLSGSMYQIVEGKRYFYPTGSCCIMNRNTLHTEEVSTEFTSLFLAVSADFISALFSSVKNTLFPGENSVFENLIFHFFEKNMDDPGTNERDFLDFVPVIAQEEQITIVHSVFEELLKTLINGGPGATFRLFDLFIRLTEILCNQDYYQAEHVTAGSNVESLLFSRINRILSLNHGRITHSELAGLLNYNGSYLGRIVRKYTGKSLFQYSISFAMAYAAEELVKTDKTIAEIASELRFTNRTHFYQLFREQYVMTPVKFRNRHKQESSRR